VINVSKLISLKKEFASIVDQAVLPVTQQINALHAAMLNVLIATLKVARNALKAMELLIKENALPVKMAALHALLLTNAMHVKKATELMKMEFVNLVKKDVFNAQQLINVMCVMKDILISLIPENARSVIVTAKNAPQRDANNVLLDSALME